MALRYGSKNASSLRYNPYSALALRYGSITMSMGEYDENATPAEYFTFTLLDDNTYSIKAANPKNMPSQVVLPSSYKGKAVTVVAENAFLTSEGIPSLSITSVYIPNSITTLGHQAFVGEPNLTEVVFEEGSQLTTISSYAFWLCEKLERITIPDSVVTIEDAAFAACKSLEVVNISRNSHLTTLGNSAFGGCSSLKEIIVPITVTEMNGVVFNSCTNLTIYCEVESKPSGWSDRWNSDNCPVVWGYIIPLGDDYLTFTEQADGTYSVKATDVSNLPSKIAIPDTYNGKAVTRIEHGAFINCSNIVKVVIPEGITTIGYGAFDGCTKLESVYIPDTVTTFEKMYIYTSTFNGCTSLREVRLPSGITEIGHSMFRDCTSLTTFTIPDTVTTIGDYAFYCNRLESIVIPSSVTTMGVKAFGTDYNNANLKIYCEATSIPSGWASDWNKSYYGSGYSPVTWGYTG